MGLESTNIIQGLEASNPSPTDFISQHDDHMRLVKSVLHNTFPDWDESLEVPVSVLNDVYKQVSADENNLIIRSEEDNELKKFYLEVGEAGVVTYEEPKVPIGSVIQSLLTETEMNFLYGDNVFVLCDGRDIETLVNDNSTQINSRLFSSFGISNAPDFSPDTQTRPLIIRQALSDTRDTATTGEINSTFGTPESSAEIGSIEAFAKKTPVIGIDLSEDGFFECDGRLLVITEYPELFDVIGTSFGSDDGGAFTFRLPNLGGRFIRMTDGAAGRDPDSASRTEMNTGGNTGNNIGSVQGDAFRSHDHTYSAWTNLADSAPNPFSTQNVGADQVTQSVGFNSNGGKETRPQNAYLSYQIRYRSIYETEATKVSEGQSKYMNYNNYIRIN